MQCSIMHACIHIFIVHHCFIIVHHCFIIVHHFSSLLHHFSPLLHHCFIIFHHVFTIFHHFSSPTQPFWMQMGPPPSGHTSRAPRATRPVLARWPRPVATGQQPPSCTLSKWLFNHYKWCCFPSFIAFYNC